MPRKKRVPPEQRPYNLGLATVADMIGELQARPNLRFIFAASECKSERIETRFDWSTVIDQSEAALAFKNVSESLAEQPPEEKTD